MDPGVAMLIASAISSTSGGIQAANASTNSKKAAKLRAKEIERETAGNLLSDTVQRGAELEGQRLQGRKKLGQRKTQSHMDASDLVRRAFNI